MHCPTCGGDNATGIDVCRGCGTPLSVPEVTDVGALQDGPSRYNGLDALRGTAMLLGSVLHAALPYMPGVEAFWPTDRDSSRLIHAIFEFIHIWRMPLLFILTGFFAN